MPASNDTVFPWTFPVYFKSFKAGREVDLFLSPKIVWGLEVDVTLNYTFTVDNLIDGYSIEEFNHTLKCGSSANVFMADQETSGNIQLSSPFNDATWNSDNLMPTHRCEINKLVYDVDQTQNNKVSFQFSWDGGVSWTTEVSANRGVDEIDLCTFHESSANVKAILSNTDSSSTPTLKRMELWYKYDIDSPTCWVEIDDKDDVTQDSSNDLNVKRVELTLSDRKSIDTFDIVIDNSQNYYKDYFATWKDVKIWFGHELDQKHVFTGLIDTVSYKIDEYNKGTVELRGRGYKAKLLNRRLTDENHRTYGDKYVGEIAENLIDTYLSTSGITTNNVDVFTSPIVNRSFETSANWTYTDSGDVWSGDCSSGYSTDYDNSMWLNATLNVDGDSSASFKQSVDFTDMHYILFDASCQINAGALSGRSDVLVDTTVLWSKENITEEFIDQSINVEAFTGHHDLIFSLQERSASSTTEDFHVYYDNIRPYGTDASCGTLVDLSFDERNTVYDAFETLCDVYGYEFWIDPDKDLHFVEDLLTADNWTFDSTYNIKRIDFTKEDTRQLKNWVKVYGLDGISDTSQNATSQTDYDRRDFFAYEPSANDVSECLVIADALLDEYDDYLVYGQLQTFGILDLNVGSTVWLCLDEADTNEEVEIAKIHYVYENNTLTTTVDLNRHQKDRWDYIKKIGERLLALEGASI